MPAQPYLAVSDLTFCYNTAQTPLFTDLTASFPEGFTGIVGANGSGKSTLLKLLTGQLVPNAGEVIGARHAISCPQRTDLPPSRLEDFLDSWDAGAAELRGRLRIDLDFLSSWQTLSHGERKRAQLACALWQEPDVLALDEPTNHIDRAARDLLLQTLLRFRGVGLIVSHDRDLLDQLCVQCLWVTPPRVKVFPGGYSQTRKQMAQDRETEHRTRTKALREHRKLQRELVRRRQNEEKNHAARSKRGITAKDSDARDRVNLARATDGNAGKTLRQLEGRKVQAEARLAAAQVTKSYDTGFWLPGSRSRRNLLLDLPAVELPLNDTRSLVTPALRLGPEDRVAITGANGLGKSTLLRHILPDLNVPEERVVYLPQELSAERAAAVLTEAKALQPEKLGDLMQIVSRLGSRPGRLLDSHRPSPGEIRKLLLALGVFRSPHLVVMDEPTNHLDLPSIEALEAALRECPCALLLVSHDERFLDEVNVGRWVIEATPGGNSALRTSSS